MLPLGPPGPAGAGANDGVTWTPSTEIVGAAPPLLDTITFGPSGEAATS